MEGWAIEIVSVGACVGEGDDDLCNKHRLLSRLQGVRVSRPSLYQLELPPSGPERSLVSISIELEGGMGGG